MVLLHMVCCAESILIETKSESLEKLWDSEVIYKLMQPKMKSSNETALKKAYDVCTFLNKLVFKDR